MKKSMLLAFFIVSASVILAQPTQNIRHKLKVFIDCNNTWCDMSFIRTEINIVDFMLDRVAADVHILVTEQNTGSGGSQYQLIYFGQNKFLPIQDTLRFSTDPNTTSFEKRDLLIKYLKLGLVRYIVKTDEVKYVEINFKSNQADANLKDSSATFKKDPWNYWVFRIGANGSVNKDAVYTDNNFNSEISANRTTDDLKVFFNISASKNKSVFTYEDAGVTQKIIVRNQNFGLWHYLVKSINQHWSGGYEVSLRQNSFSNLKRQAYFRTAIEYDIFPYKQVNSRYFAISYGFTIRNNHYYDSTLYNKMRETLIGQQAEATISFIQKWGSTSVGINYHNYFNNWKFFNFGANLTTSVRITGGLSFYVIFSGALTRDQINLPKGGATEQEILTRRRQIASGYTISTSFGLNYRFGSKLNNFVNPRFEGPSN